MGEQRIRVAVMIAGFALTFVSVQAATRYRLQQKRLPDWSLIPYQIGNWAGLDGRFDPIYGDDPADASLLRIYQQGANPPVIAYVGFFRDLPTMLEVHTPEYCYPAQGWTIFSMAKAAAGNLRGTRIPATQIVVTKNGDRRLVVWWYSAGSRPFETRIRYVYGMLARSMFTGRTDGSMVRLETPVEKNAEAPAIIRTEEFEKSFLPELDRVLPR